ncbi:MAG: DUF418 domain-containing protein [Phycisphaerales bacterium]
MNTAEAPALAPTTSSQRIQALDIARGIALFGIFMVNIQLMVQPLSYIMGGGGSSEGPIAAAFHYITRIFFESKSYPLFSMLFGMGLIMMYDRAKSRGKMFAPTYIRRLFLLLLFGISHAFLVWYGDILIYYAVFGFCIMWLAPIRPKTMLLIGGSLMVLAALWVCLLAALGALLNQGAQPPMSGIENATFTDLWQGLKQGKVQAGPLDPAWGDAEVDSIRNGPFMTAVAMRTLSWVSGVFFWVGFGGVFLHVPAMFLIGGAIMRGVVMNDANSPWPKRFILLALLVGLPGAIVSVLMSELSEPNSVVMNLSMAVTHLTGPFVSMGYIGFAVWLARSKAGLWLVGAISSAGRMALTNYLCQSLFIAAFAQHWGLAQFGEVSRVGMIALVVSVYVFQLAFSVFWLNLFTMGPFEYIWRTATYLRFPKLLKTG